MTQITAAMAVITIKGFFRPKKAKKAPMETKINQAHNVHPKHAMLCERICDIKSCLIFSNVTISFCIRSFPSLLNSTIQYNCIINFSCLSNVANQTVTWCSSNDSVAAVNTYSGKVTAKKAGTTTITATTVDGGFMASCTVTVFIDTVTIQKDGNFNKVVFSKSGKVWHCINHDMLFNEENRSNQTLINRTRHNFLTYYDEQNPPNSNWTPKEYTDDELKLLYAIDPYGVADYVEKFAPGDEGGLENTIREKDRVFKLLFERDPKYFARTIDGVWYESADNDNLSVVISESELLFGMHPLNDLVTVLALVDIAKIIIPIRVFQLTLSTPDVIERIAKCWYMFVTSGEESAKQEILSWATEFIIEKAFDAANLGWAVDLVTLHESLTDIAAVIDMNNLKFYNNTFSYCLEETNYQIFVELKSGTKHKIDDINALINY